MAPLVTSSSGPGSFPLLLWVLLSFRLRLFLSLSKLAYSFHILGLSFRPYALLARRTLLLSEYLRNRILVDCWTDEWGRDRPDQELSLGRRMLFHFYTQPFWLYILLLALAVLEFLLRGKIFCFFPLLLLFSLVHLLRAGLEMVNSWKWIRDCCLSDYHYQRLENYRFPDLMLVYLDDGQQEFGWKHPLADQERDFFARRLPRNWSFRRERRGYHYLLLKERIATRPHAWLREVEFRDYQGSLAQPPVPGYHGAIPFLARSLGEGALILANNWQHFNNLNKVLGRDRWTREGVLYYAATPGHEFRSPVGDVASLSERNFQEQLGPSFPPGQSFQGLSWQVSG